MSSKAPESRLYSGDILEACILQQESLQLPVYAVPVGSTMPEKAFYDAATQTLGLHAGRWEHVLPEVWNYTIGGINVIDSWVGH